jgi:hypothetical protein
MSNGRDDSIDILGYPRLATGVRGKVEDSSLHESTLHKLGSHTVNTTMPSSKPPHEPPNSNIVSLTKQDLTTTGMVGSHTSGEASVHSAIPCDPVQIPVAAMTYTARQETCTSSGYAAMQGILLHVPRREAAFRQVRRSRCCAAWRWALEDGVRPSPMVLMSGRVAYCACLSGQVEDAKILFAKELFLCAHFSTCHTKVSC